MLSAIKDWFRSPKPQFSEEDRLKQIEKGYIVGFSYMAQSGISGKRFTVEDAHTYNFDGEKFQAFQLVHESRSTPIQMIVQFDEEDSYITLSIPLDESDQKELFGRSLDKNDSIFMQDKIVVHTPVSERLVGWYTSQYKKVIDGTEGCVIRSDSPSSDAAEKQQTKPFRYYLFVSESNEFAIELEKYEQGDLKIFLTQFRPTSDIAHIKKGSGSDVRIEPKEAAKDITDMNGSRASAYVSPIPQTPLPVVIEPAVMVARSKSEVQIKPIEKSKPIQNSAAGSRQMVIPCPASVAVKLIEEARRNEVPLSQLMRKVLGLPVHYDETVMIPLQMTDSDLDQLAKKLNVNSRDHNELKSALIKELALFTGEEMEDRIEEVA